jgi:hypothetical protein
MTDLDLDALENTARDARAAGALWIRVFPNTLLTLIELARAAQEAPAPEEWNASSIAVHSWERDHE